MLDDPRNHDPRPTDEEREWMEPSALELLLRSAAALVNRSGRAATSYAGASTPAWKPASSR
jgi:hypothetical protein